MSARRRGALILSLLVAVALIVVAVVIAGGRRDAEPTSAFDPSVPTSTHTPPPASPTPTEKPSTEPGDTADPSDPADPADPADPSAPTDPAPSLSPEQRTEISEQSTVLLEDVLEETAEIDPNSQQDIVGDLSAVASQAYLSELESERLEFAAEGWTREGSYSLGQAEVLDHTSSADGEVATVRVCVDSSALVTRRTDGEILETSPSSDRAWNVFVLERAEVSADWRIVGRSFSDDPAC
ncbi:hypothetical protein [Brachybacterium sp. UNK5269]|uniref:hypothetical protein n=1 Tax=Brachybacterium sp. UNK5269 TaxID=3408576 RepID=UPI003BAF5F19